MKKKLLTVVAALLVLFTIVPVSSFAAGSLSPGGLYEVPLEVLKPDVDEVSAAGRNMGDVAYLYVDDNGEVYAVVTLLNAAYWQSIKTQETQPGSFDEDNFVEAEVLTDDAEANIREVKFHVPNVNEALNAKIHIVVTGVPGMGTYENKYDIRLKFHMDEAVPYNPYNDEEYDEDGVYVIDFQVLHATEDKASAMSRYVATPAHLIIKNGLAHAILTFTDKNQITGFQVEYDGEYIDAETVDVDLDFIPTRDVMFFVPNLSDILNAKVQVHVAEQNYTGSYDVRIAFDPTTMAPYVPGENVVTFDDIQNSWAKTYIEDLAKMGVINGVSENRFAPDATVTRAQFTVMLVRALGLSLEAYEGLFADVPETMSWAAREIEAANRANIVLGNEGKFDPNSLITREQMVTMVIRALKYVNPELVEAATSSIPFADEAQIAGYAKEAVDAAVALGVVNGIVKDGQTFFAPKDHASRAQAAKVIYEMIAAFE